MKKRKKTSFTIGERCLPKPPQPEPVRDRPGCRRPTGEEIVDLAIALARDEYDMETPLLELFYWPAWATPCNDPRKLFLPIVEKYKKKAEEMLRRHYEYYYDLEQRRKRWLRAHPIPRSWGWTRKPLRHAVPPPRRRSFRPPGLAFPDRGAPPPPRKPSDSPKRPGWRERELFLWHDWLFDNGIAFPIRKFCVSGAKNCAGD